MNPSLWKIRHGNPRTTAQRSALVLLLVVSAVSPARLSAAAGRCGYLDDPEYVATWDRIYDETGAEWNDRDLLSELSRQRLPTLSANTSIHGPEGSGAAAAVLADMLRTVDGHLRAMGVRSSTPTDVHIVLYDAVEGYTAPSGNTTPAWFTCEENRPECFVEILREGWELPELELKHLAAHEFFHVAQGLAVPEVDNCKNKWWTEGTAEWFANRVVPGSEWSLGFLQKFDRTSGDTSLTRMQYEAQAFFFWAGERFDAEYPINLGRRGDNVLKNAGRVAATLPAEEWQKFLETYLRGELTYPDGRPAIPNPNLGEARSGPWSLTGPPLSFPRVQMTLEPGEWELGVEANAEYVGFGDEGSWTRVATGAGEDTITHEVECPEPVVLTMAAVSLDGTDLDAVALIEGGEAEDCYCAEPIPEDHCLVGAWLAAGTDAPEVYNRETKGSRWLAQKMGDSRFTFNADGTFAQVTGNAQSDFERRRDGELEIEQTVNITSTTLGRWMTVDEDKIEVCVESFEGQMTTLVTIDGRTRRSGPFPIPYDSGTEESVANYWFTCSAGSAELRQLVDGTVIVTWRGERVP